MKCFQCNQEKPVEEYYTKTIRASGIHHKFKRCKLCQHANNVNRYKGREQTIKDNFTLAGFVCY